MTCAKCGKEYEESKFCPECGAPASVFCSKCGKEHSQKFCPECGTAAHDYAVQTQPNIVINNTNTNTNANTNVNTNMNFNGAMRPQKSRMVALILCIFLGYVGAHCFYTGKTGMGVIYIFTLGLFGIGWIIDIVRIIIGSYRDKWGVPLA